VFTPENAWCSVNPETKRAPAYILYLLTIPASAGDKATPSSLKKNAGGANLDLCFLCPVDLFAEKAFWTVKME